MAEAVAISGLGVAAAIPAHAQVAGFAPPKQEVKPTAEAPAEQVKETPQSSGTPDALLQAIQDLTKSMSGSAPAVTPTEDLNSLDISKIEDPTVRSMASALKTLGKGLDMNRALGKAIETGNAEFIDRAYLAEKGGALAPDLINIAEGILTTLETKATESVTKVYTKAGSKESWDAASSAFDTNAPQSLKLAVKTMFDSGNLQHIDAAAELVITYAQQNGHISARNGTIQGGDARAGQGQGYTKEQFQAELFKLNQNMNDRDYAAKRADLFDRRRLGVTVGI